MVTVCHAIALKENNADEVCGIIKLTAEKKNREQHLCGCTGSVQDHLNSSDTFHLSEKESHVALDALQCIQRHQKLQHSDYGGHCSVRGRNSSRQHLSLGVRQCCCLPSLHTD